MMKPRSSRVIGERNVPGTLNKTEAIVNGSSAVQRNQAQLSQVAQTSAQAIRKRRSSINVYDQPSSLNSRLRQLETDMLRLDEDRTKLFDDTHSALAQYELRLNEIHAIIKSRQDNVEKYVEDMRLLLQAKEEFERQAKLLNDRQERIHEKFMHRETTVAREIKLLKNKFELLERNRQFRSILQKSTGGGSIGSNTLTTGDNNEPDIQENTQGEFLATETADSLLGDESQTNKAGKRRKFSIKRLGASTSGSRKKGTERKKSLSKFGSLGCLVVNLFKPKNKLRHRSNRVSTGLPQPTANSYSPNVTVKDGEPSSGEQDKRMPAKGRKRAGFIGRLFG